MIVEPLTKGHYRQLVLQPAQASIGGRITDDVLDTLMQWPAYAAVAGDRVLAICGVAQHHPGRAHGWALFAADLGVQMTAVVRAIRRFLRVCGYARVETTVVCDHREGHRLARLLGFVCECERMTGFGEDGEDHAMYRWAG